MLVPILITCTQFALTGDSGTFVKAMAAPVVGSESQPVGLILENNTDADADLALALFRNSLTRGIVVDFYNSITRSAEITQAVLEAAAEYSIPPSLAFALCGVESQFNSRALNRNAVSIDRGLFQLNSLSFPELTESDFFSVRKNAEHGMKHLRYCLDRGENEVVALAMYNAGEGRVSDTGAPKTTLTYISRILDLKSELETRFRETVLEKFSS
ncbi:MAG: transglycosylase SLT domain-containing protein [Spirochaetales bacterium]|nr:transglycosylase SLT domain-containing protein [Spirochaetales bacterium]